MGKVSQTQVMNVLLSRSFIYIAYLKQLHVSAFLSRPSSGWTYVLFEDTIQWLT